MVERIIKVIKEAEKKRHENHVQAGKSVWQHQDLLKELNRKMADKKILTAKELLEFSEWYQAGKLDGEITTEKIKKIIKDYKNPYPKDIFSWDNKEKLEFNRGRFNEFIFNVVENTRNEILREIEDE